MRVERWEEDVHRLFPEDFDQIYSCLSRRVNVLKSMDKSDVPGRRIFLCSSCACNAIADLGRGW